MTLALCLFDKVNQSDSVGWGKGGLGSGSSGMITGRIWDCRDSTGGLYQLINSQNTPTPTSQLNNHTFSLKEWQKALLQRHSNMSAYNNTLERIHQKNCDSCKWGKKLTGRVEELLTSYFSGNVGKPSFHGNAQVFFLLPIVFSVLVWGLSFTLKAEGTAER